MAWTTQYEAVSLPDASTPVWTKSGGGGTEEISPAGYLHLTSAAGAGIYYDSATDTDLKSETGVTVETKMRVLVGEPFDWPTWASGVSSIEIHVNDIGATTKYCFVGIFSDGVAVSPSNDYYAFDTTDAYHIYRVTLKNEITYVYVDGVLRLTEPTINDSGGAVNERIVFSGDINGVLGIDTLWDYVYINNGGAVSPKNQQLKQNKYR